jgi:hypothetical protein
MLQSAGQKRKCYSQRFDLAIHGAHTSLQEGTNTLQSLHESGLRSGAVEVILRMNAGEFVVCEERSKSCGCVHRIVVSEFG